MDNQLKIILIDAVVYLVTFVYWARKLRKLNVGMLLLFIMTISHIGAIFYYAVLKDLGVFDFNMTIYPFVFLYCMIMLNIMPFLKYKGVYMIDARGNERLILLLSLVVIVLNIEPFLENIYLLLSPKGDFSDVYDNMREETLQLYSSIGENLMRWASYFKLIVPISFFYYLSQSKKKKILISGLGMCMVNYILQLINIGSRGGVATQFVVYVLCFIFFSPLFHKKTIKQVKKTIVMAALLLGFVFMAITLSRFNSSSGNKTLYGWLLLYTSEGPIRFSNQMWDGEHNTNGDVNMSYIKSLMGLKTYTTFAERNEYYLAKNGREIEVFYTYVGDFVSDFGIFGAFIVCFILFFLTKRMLTKNGVIPFPNLIFIIIMFQLLSIGFASNIFRSNSLQRVVFILFWTFLIMHYFHYKYKNKRIEIRRNKV